MSSYVGEYSFSVVVKRGTEKFECGASRGLRIESTSLAADVSIDQGNMQLVPCLLLVDGWRCRRRYVKLMSGS